MSGKKSLLAKIEENILMRIKPEFMDSQMEIEKYLALKSQNRKNEVKSVFKSTDFNGMQVFRYGKKDAENTIIFMHGGAYVNEINMQHHLFCLKLSRKLDAYVLAPVYSLAPNHKAREAFDEITELYKNLLKDHSKITLIGDSAGGGFVLSFCQYLNTLNLAQPAHIIAISPWVDISMSNPPYDSENDCILGEIGLKEIGKSWAGDLNTKDYRVSPVFGNTDGLADTLIFAGTGEIFYKDIKKYAEKQKNTRLITGEEMFHIYPLFPSGEAKEAFKEIKKEINK